MKIMTAILVQLSLLWGLSASGPSPDTMTTATPGASEHSMAEAMFYQVIDDRTLQCLICFRECIIPEGERGFCRNKEHIDGVLYSLVHSRPSAVQVDPIEKEPQFHNLPGSRILCVGTAGCNYACRHCHNWHLSQQSIDDIRYMNMTPEHLVSEAMMREVRTISFTYNDPISMYEYVYDTARLAAQHGLNILWHSNGSMNPEPLRELLKYTHAVTIDLKGFSSHAYQNSRASLEPVLEALKIIGKSDVWLEIVNLVIPTINDDPEEIRAMCRWISEHLGNEVPLHFTRFVPAYRLTHLPRTPVETLEQAYAIAREEGLSYVTIGNVPGHQYNSTFCPSCDSRVIHRTHFTVIENLLIDGACRECGHSVPGIWK